MFEWLWNGFWSTLWEWFTTLTLGFIPTWLWVLIVIAGAAYIQRKFGWYGLAAFLLFALSLGSYRQGWRDAKNGEKPFFPVEQHWPDVQPSPRKPADMILKDIFKSPKLKRKYNADTNTWE